MSKYFHCSYFSILKGSQQEIFKIIHAAVLLRFILNVSEVGSKGLGVPQCVCYVYGLLTLCAALDCLLLILGLK